MFGMRDAGGWVCLRNPSFDSVYGCRVVQTQPQYLVVDKS